MGSSPLIGLGVVVVVLAAATGFALIRRGKDGTFRPVGEVTAPVPPAEPTDAAHPTDIGNPTAVAHPTDAIRADAGQPTETRQVDGLAGTLAALGVRAGTPVTLVQFSSAFCAPCRVTRALCHDVAARVPGVHHLDIDAEKHLDAVRTLGILRTPTLLVVDAAGRIRRRATGAPTRAQLLAAVADVVDVSAS